MTEATSPHHTTEDVNAELSMSELAQQVARKLGPGWTSASGTHPAADDRDALLLGPNSEVLQMLRLHHLDPDPGEWNRIEVRGLAPANLSAGAQARVTRVPTTRPHKTNSPARFAYFIRRYVLDHGYTHWLMTEKLNTSDPAPPAESESNSTTTRLRLWCARHALSYDTSYDESDGRLVLLVGGERFSPGDAERRILGPAENEAAYETFAKLATERGPDQAAADVELIGTHSAVIADWIARWKTARPEQPKIADRPQLERTEPEIIDPWGPRHGYQLWARSDGRDWAYFAASPYNAVGVQMLDGWRDRVVGLNGAVSLTITKPGKAGEPDLVHPLSGSTYSDTDEARKTLFSAGLLAVKVYRDQVVTVQAWKRVGRGYGLRSRVLVLDYQVPPAVDVTTMLDEAYAVTLPVTAAVRSHDVVGLHAKNYQRRQYRPALGPGDLVTIDGETYERTTEDGWRLVTPQMRAADPVPAVIPVDDRFEVDGIGIANGHHFDATALVPLDWGRFGWEANRGCADNVALTLTPENPEHRWDNAACEAQQPDDTDCHPSDHKDAAESVFEAPRPSGAELIPLLGAAVLDAHHAQGSSASAEIKRAFDLAQHSPHHELGEVVLRAFAGLKLRDAPPGRAIICPDGSRVLRLTQEEHAIVAAFLAGAGEANHSGIFSSALQTLRDELFPVDAFEQWHAGDTSRYEPDMVVTEMTG